MLKDVLHWCHEFAALNNSKLPLIVGSGDYGAETEFLNSAFAGRSPSECPWDAYITDPELLAFTDELALVEMLPWLIICARESGDLACNLHSTLQRASEDYHFSQQLEAKYQPNSIQATLDFLCQEASTTPSTQTISINEGKYSQTANLIDE